MPFTGRTIPAIQNANGTWNAAVREYIEPPRAAPVVWLTHHDVCKRFSWAPGDFDFASALGDHAAVKFPANSKRDKAGAGPAVLRRASTRLLAMKVRPTRSKSQ